ncbi:type I-A CRISPR-associated protein Cas7/Csa2 [Desulfurococcus mucosus]|uniref:CRISPR-associated autoregulator, DevR family n=1 Tax=Desulfurococcus mucosus (strain ATCC 35584 / DSM 2162 / JCM 9187 / O7/1) TaxID=765177 RepID=E8R9X0_DESM0|nr:type I-A CRISPR-associated protein Cas7/Csa2 [Desulfurococcus mucosus]ADV65296.1 CRISPR-associated autoregulator, DevR family [Desulfurococcus mucosus DSM 2162]
MVNLCLAARVRANVEALNMTETIGNVSKHRRAPYIISTREGYKLVYVPAISGESLGHAFQANLVDAAQYIYGVEKKPVPLDPYSARYEFVKFSDSKHLPESLKKILEESGKKKKEGIEELQHLFEKTAIQESIVADIGGFMLAEKMPVRRTSLFEVGYAVPVEEAVSESIIEAQMHARQAVVGLEVEEKTSGKKAGEEAGEGKEAKQQMLYYVEVASTVYGMSMCIDLGSIGVTSMVKREEAVAKDEKLRRVKSALLALAMTFGLQLYGAKRSRFSPVLSIENMVAVISKPLPIAASPPQVSTYIEETVSRVQSTVAMLKKLGVTEDAIVLVYGKDVKDAAVFKTPEALFDKLFDEVLKRVG